MRNSGFGPVIAIVGIDGVGKSSVVEELNRALEARGRSAKAFRQPSDTKIGKLAREYLESAQDYNPMVHAHLLAADHIDQCAVYRKHRSNDVTVIVDRWTPLGLIAYQGKGHGSLMSDIYHFLGTCDTFFPELVIWLDCDTDLAQARIRERGTDEVMPPEFLEDVRLGYDYAIKEFRDEGGRTLVIDAAQQLGDIIRQIVPELDRLPPVYG